jgi:hypothetical protein
MAKARVNMARSEKEEKVRMLGRLVLSLCVSAAPGWATPGMIADSLPFAVLSAVVITRNHCTTNLI